MQELYTFSGEDKERAFTVWSNAFETSPESIRNKFRAEAQNYLNLPLKTVVHLMENAVEIAAQEWLTQNPTTEDQVALYYDQSTIQVLEQLQWHSEPGSSLTDGLNAAILAQRYKFNTILDYGCGIGSHMIYYSKQGVRVTGYDISDPVIQFARWRLEEYQVEAQIIDGKEQPLEGRYDMALSLHTLEHILDPAQALKDLANAVKTGGILYICAPFFEDEERPMHLHSAFDLNDAARNLGLEVLPFSTSMRSVFIK